MAMVLGKLRTRIAGRSIGELARRGIWRLASGLGRVAAPFERLSMRRQPLSERLAPPPVFIIGSPRSGSTILYQVLANSYRLEYISNLSCILYHSLSMGTRLHHFLFGERAFDRFDSEHGRTRGLIEPSECGKFWYRWFPRDRHFVAAGELSEAALRELRRTIAAVIDVHSRPLLIKNLNCGQRLQVLREALPEALFLFCRRDPLATAHSILRAREKAQGTKEEWWSVMPRQVHELERLPYPEQVVRQVYHLEIQMEHDLRLFPGDQSMVVSYEGLCDDLGKTLQEIEEFFLRNGVVLERREGASLPQLRRPEPPIGDAEEYERLRAEVAKLDW